MTAGRRSRHPFAARCPGLERRRKRALDGKTEVVHTFGWYNRKMIADTQAKGATPIVLSPTIRNVWRDGQIERGSGRYGQWSAEVAKRAGVQFIDVSQLVADKFQPMS